MDLLCFEVTTNAARLDVDDIGGTQRDRVGGGFGGHDRFVQAHGRAHLLGKQCVLADVGLAQWLFDEQEPKVVQLLQVSGVNQGVRGVGVDLEQEVVTEFLSHSRNGFDVLARLDLELDAGVALFHVPANDLEEFGDGVLDSHAHTGWNRVRHATQVVLEGQPRGLQLRVQDRHFHG